MLWAIAPPSHHVLRLKLSALFMQESPQYVDRLGFICVCASARASVTNKNNLLLLNIFKQHCDTAKHGVQPKCLGFLTVAELFVCVRVRVFNGFTLYCTQYPCGPAPLPDDMIRCLALLGVADDSQ